MEYLAKWVAFKGTGTRPSAYYASPPKETKGYFPGWRPKNAPKDAPKKKSPVIWEWESRGTWRAFSTEESAELCRLMTLPEGRGTWEARNTIYEGDVLKMHQKNISTGGLRIIRMRPVDYERPSLLQWADQEGGWKLDKELDAKLIIAIRNGKPVQHCEMEFHVNFASNCLYNELTSYTFKPSNNLLPLARQMDWGRFQWRKDDEAWLDFGPDESIIIDKAWKGGEFTVCFVRNGHPHEVSFVSWTLLNLEACWAAKVQIGQRLNRGENTLPATPTFEYHYGNRWHTFTERVDTLLSQGYDKQQPTVSIPPVLATTERTSTR